MSSDGSITVLLQALKDGLSEEAAQGIFQRYIERLERVARTRIAGMRLRDRDEQDLAIVVMEQFFLGVRNGRFPRLIDRHDLWQVVLMLVERRAIDLYRRRQEPLRGESALFSPDLDGSQTGGAGGAGMIPSLEPTPAMIVEMEEVLRRRLDQLPEGLRQIAVWRMEGRTNAEIAQQLNRSVKRVEAKLNLIRKIWNELRLGP